MYTTSQLNFLLKKSIELIINKNYSSAEIYLKQLIKIDSKNSEAYRYLGVIYAVQKDLSNAIEYLNSSLRLSPKNYLTLTNLGTVYVKQKNFDQAYNCFSKALKINPSYHEAWSELGLLNFETRNYETALSNYETALKINSNFNEAWLNKANLLLVFNREREAEDIYKKLIYENQENFEARYNYSLFLLNRKQFYLGWKEYEYRWKSYDFNSKAFNNNLRRWNPEVSTNELIIWAEQGIGDQILYSTFLQYFNHAGSGVTVALEEKLTPIISRSFQKINFISIDDFFKEVDLNYKSQIPIASLGMVFRNHIDSFPLENKYLICDENITNSIKPKLKKTNKLRCGISWKSSNRFLGDEKSIPINIFLSIFNDLEFDFINLQHDIGADEINLLNSNKITPFISEMDIYNNLDVLLSMINLCDLIVTSSNSIAHLAGALGKKCIVIVPYCVGKFWYWHERNGMSLWYPSIKVFKQVKQGDWAEPIIDANNYLRTNFV